MERHCNESVPCSSCWDVRKIKKLRNSQKISYFRCKENLLSYLLLLRFAMLASNALTWQQEGIQPWLELIRMAFQKSLITTAIKESAVKFTALLVREDAMKKCSTQKERIHSFSMERGSLWQGKNTRQTWCWYKFFILFRLIAN